jgi:hypothetical protein
MNGRGLRLGGEHPHPVIERILSDDPSAENSID